jgi:hypothetical protein
LVNANVGRPKLANFRAVCEFRECSPGPAGNMHKMSVDQGGLIALSSLKSEKKARPNGDASLGA